MQCVRCLKETASKVAEAPDGSDAWELYFCNHCHYVWRNTEPDYITDIAKRDPWGQLGDRDDIEGTKIIAQSEYQTMKKNPSTGR